MCIARRADQYVCLERRSESLASCFVNGSLVGVAMCALVYTSQVVASIASVTAWPYCVDADIVLGGDFLFHAHELI